MKDLKGLKVNFLGDSITEGTGASCPEARFVNVFAAKTGAVARNYGIGGTRIAIQQTPSVKTRYDLYFGGRVNEMEQDADLIVVFGGTNDFGHGDARFGDVDGTDADENNFCGAVRALILRLFERYPTAEIVFMTPLHRKSERVTTNEIGLPCHVLYDYVDAIRRITAAYGIPCLDLWSTSGIAPRVPGNCKTYTADGLHPNDRGMERVADRLIAFLGTI